MITYQKVAMDGDRPLPDINCGHEHGTKEEAELCYGLVRFYYTIVECDDF